LERRGGLAVPLPLQIGIAPRGARSGVFVGAARGPREHQDTGDSRRRRQQFLHGFAPLLRCPYISSSANSTHLYSISRAFFSVRRYSGILIFQARVKTFGSSMVASYRIVSGPAGV